MNGFVLTSSLASVILLTRRQPFYPSAAHDKFYSICTTFGGYTEFWIAPNPPNTNHNILPKVLILLLQSSAADICPVTIFSSHQAAQKIHH